MMLVLASTSELVQQLCTLFVWCDLCQRIEHSFEEIDIVIGQLDWYLFPNEINRMIPTILIVTQEPVGFNYFGSVSCNRKAFNTVYIENSVKLRIILFSNGLIDSCRLFEAAIHILWYFVDSSIKSVESIRKLC